MKHIPSNASPEELRRVFLKLQEEVSKLQSNSITQQASIDTLGQGQGNGNNNQPITTIMTLHTEFSGTPSDLTIDEDGRAVLKQVQVREVAG
jgi:hypothetical protein